MKDSIFSGVSKWLLPIFFSVSLICPPAFALKKKSSEIKKVLAEKTETVGYPSKPTKKTKKLKKEKRSPAKNYHTELKKFQETTINAAVQCESRGDIIGGISVLVQYIENYPKHYGIIVYMGWLNYLLKRYDDALGWFDEAIKINSKNPLGFQRKMIVYLAKNDSQGALREGKIALSLDPSNPIVASIIRDLLLDKKNPSEALTYFMACPTDTNCRLGMGLCYFELRQFDNARPLLMESQSIFPEDEKLKKALKYINWEELKYLKREVVSSKTDPQTLQGKKKRLADLYEIVGVCNEKSNFIRGLFPQNPNGNETLQMARLLNLAGYHEEAAKNFEKSAAQPQNSWDVRLDAVDNYIAARDFSNAEGLLTVMSKESPGYDLDKRFGLVFMATDRVKKARDIFIQAERHFEALAARSPNPVEFHLQAIDACLDGKLHRLARTILAKIQRGKANYEIDSRFARFYFDSGQFGKAIEIYSKYTEKTEMQISRGKAYIKLHYPMKAKEIFQTILVKSPQNREAIEALANLEPNRPWEIHIGGSGVNYGSYQDSKRTWVTSVGYNHRQADKAMSTVSYMNNRIETMTLTGATLRENLLGLKFYYRFDPRWATQIHGTIIDSNNWHVGRGNVFGGGIFFYPMSRWNLGIEANGSNFKNAKSTQIDPWVSFKVCENLKLVLRGCFITVSGPVFSFADHNAFNSAKTSLVFTPNTRFKLDLSTWEGARRLEFDSENLFSFNDPDLYRSAGMVEATYRFGESLRVVGKYHLTSMMSEWQTILNKTRGYQVISPYYTLRFISFGCDAIF